MPSYPSNYFREGPCGEGVSWAVCGSGAPPYTVLDLSYMVFLTASFPRETAEERLDLKGLKGSPKAEKVRTPGPELLYSLRRPLKAL